MNAHCPKCGDVAKFVSQKSPVIGFVEMIFKCQGTKCGAEVVADVHLSTRKTPAARCFTATEVSLDKQTRTDC